MESDRERIFQEITDSIGMDEFNRQLQEYLEGAMRAAAMEALLQRGGLESVGAGGSNQSSVCMYHIFLLLVKCLVLWCNVVLCCSFLFG